MLRLKRFYFKPSIYTTKIEPIRPASSPIKTIQFLNEAGKLQVDQASFDFFGKEILLASYPFYLVFARMVHAYIFR
jgi:hypothetical protein